VWWRWISVPWRGPERPGEFPSLGYLVADLIEAKCAIPDGPHAGQPFLLTDEMLTFLLWHYRLKPNARAGMAPSSAWWFPRGSQLVRPQKWGKGPFSAAIVCAECDGEGPVLFDGWDADGEPVGRPWETPHFQITAVSEDQTDNVWRALLPMIELGAIAADMPDTGETRINLPSGGLIEPVTASARSRLGQRITGALEDETHSWVERNGGRKLADTQRRNLAGMKGRFLETTNAWDPAERSVAQLTFENPVAVHVDYAQPIAGSVRNKRERRKVMRSVYRDSCRDDPDGRWRGWVDLDRVDVEVEALIAHDAAQAERFFLNRIHAGESVAFSVEDWAARADSTVVVADRSLIVIGVDGARFDDALAIVATDVEQGHQWPLAIIERPENADEDYEHDFAVADGALSEAFDRWRVWRVYIDPQYIDSLRDGWRGRYGEKVVIDWFTNRPRQIAWAVRNFRSAIVAGDLTHDGDEVMARHVANARRMPLLVKDDEGRPMWSIQKDRRGSPRKIDAAMAGVLSWEARGDAIAAGALTEKPQRMRGGST
jgi:hypothetical protein